MATLKTESYTKEQLGELKALGVDVSNQEKIKSFMLKELKDTGIDMNESDALSEVMDLFLAIKEMDSTDDKKSTATKKDQKKTKKVVEEVDEEEVLDDLAIEVKDKKKEADLIKKEKIAAKKEVAEESVQNTNKAKKRSAFTLFDQNSEEHLEMLLKPFKDNFEDYGLSYKIIHDGMSVKHNSFNSSGRTLFAIKRAKINNETNEFIVTIAITGLRLHKDREEIIKSILKNDQVEKYGVEFGNMPSIYGISIPECIELLKGCIDKMTATFEKLETRLNSNRVKMEEQVKGSKMKVK
jgi:hypothetical protein